MVGAEPQRARGEGEGQERAHHGPGASSRLRAQRVFFFAAAIIGAPAAE